MVEGSFKRKLAAVFSADAVGYSRLMGEDEAATVRTLEFYKGVMSELIKLSPSCCPAFTVRGR